MWSFFSRFQTPYFGMEWFVKQDIPIFPFYCGKYLKFWYINVPCFLNCLIFQLGQLIVVFFLTSVCDNTQSQLLVRDHRVLIYIFCFICVYDGIYYVSRYRWRVTCTWQYTESSFPVIMDYCIFEGFFCISQNLQQMRNMF